MFEIATLILAHALVWAMGVAILAALPGHPRRPTVGPVPGDGRAAWLVGAGWFVGAFVLTLLMRALSALSVPFGRLSTLLPIAACTLAAVLVAGRRSGNAMATPIDWRNSVRRVAASVLGSGLPGPQRVAWLLLISWLALRYGMLLVEVMTRPLYAWDAWIQWATKARVWYELGTMAPFRPLSEWLSAGGPVYFDAAPHYPGTVPLWQVWAAVLVGRWADSLINLAWWCTGLALPVAIFGFLRGAGSTPLAALAGAALVATLPILDTHVALAGYADLPLAAFLCIAVLAGWRLAQQRSWRELAVLALALIALPTIKSPGKLWIVLLLPGLLTAFAPRWGLRIAAATVVLMAALMLVFAHTDPVVLGYRLHLEWKLPWQSLLEAYFVYANWHLLWFAAVAVALLGRRSLLAPPVAPLTVTLSLGLLFLLFGFAFTNAAQWVEDQSTVNRATLHLAPLLAVWVVSVFGEWANGTRVPPGEPPPAATQTS